MNSSSKDYFQDLVFEGSSYLTDFRVTSTIKRNSSVIITICNVELVTTDGSGVDLAGVETFDT